jgi:transcriptional regulator with XRE-family HTH domain
MTVASRSRVFNAEQIGQLIRLRRKSLGYTQRYVADMMGISPRLVGEIEKGRETVGIQKVIDMATGLGIDIELKPRGA